MEKKKKKKILYILLAILIIILIIVGLLLFLKKDTAVDVYNEFPFFGFGGGAGGGTISDDSEPIEKEDEFTTTPFPILRQISFTPTAGATIVKKEEETTIGTSTVTNTVYSARYMERATGHIYEIRLDRPDEPKRISNTTIPKVHNAIWGKDGKSIIARYLDDSDSSTIKTYYAKLSIPRDNTMGSLSGHFMFNNILDISLSPQKDSAFFLLENNTSDELVALGFTTEFENGDENMIFNFPVTEWLSQWATKDDIFLTSKASSEAFGYIYRIDSSGSFERIIGDIRGLTTLVNDSGNKLLYSQSIDDTVLFGMYDLDTRKYFTMPMTTLPEKCTWRDNGVGVFCGIPKDLTSAQYPDDWYKSKMQFSDDFWFINTETGLTLELAITSEYTTDKIDAIKPTLSDNEKYLIFTNKQDMTVWVLELSDLFVINE